MSRQEENDVRANRIREFITNNYQSYFGVLIFTPRGPVCDLTIQANDLWLAKNGVDI